ncbi:PREDICTED: FACT complex subunit SPT16-like isoform X1 [Populus euphratica]|uniref:FACT complex subunit n=1 Tax=Populus euphratica TaxID=75702 RepID=A0AAJ6Y1F7_POPEU|nr:PREDICTED: FACT complex subunit SPT16-like isoform X1 [Populus euphratica]XP_011039013.1 PREDICTED: FACT complex subunit SPT16-like isoform X1 [Populus euphratica]XP_011039014.1 PREDICTED: FACT complex subunit SPT16-like isoform X1 [Populus euphratica]
MAESRNANAKSSNGKPSGAVSPYAIDLDNFTKRLNLLYSHWKEHHNDLWGASDVLAIATPPASEDLRYLKSSALNIWLVGYEFPETIMVFLKKQIHFLCSQKKASLLEVVKKPAKEAVGVEVGIHVKTKSDDGSGLMDIIFRAVHSQSNSNGHDTPVIGHIARESPEGKLLETWDEKLKNANCELSDVTNGFSDLFAVKDSIELTNVRKAAFLTSSVMKQFVVPKLEQVIDEEKKISHSSLMGDTEKAILEPARIKVKLKAENVDICYPPVFQSGGEFDLKPSAASNDENLYYDSTSVIICAIGSRYNSYCSNIARTFLIDANPLQSKAYEVLLKAHEAAISELKSGNKISAVYQAALSVVEKDAPELIANLTKTAGTGIGLEFRESGLSLNLKNDRILRQGMVFNVSLGFQNLQAETKNLKTQKYSVLLADTVIVGEKIPDVVTSKSTKAVKDVAYSFNEDDQEEDQPKVKPELRGSKTILSKATLRSDNHEMSKEELRRQHQAELARQKNEETARRLAGGGSSATDNRGGAKTIGDLVAYKNVNDLPPPREFMIQIDQKNEAIILPIHGSMVPFHVATVKSVSSQQDGNRTCYIRIIFNVPGTPFSPHDANSLKFQGSIYLKEVSFRSKDSRHISEVVQQIKTLRRQVTSRESERAERATLVSQEKLQLSSTKFKPIKLLDLWVRPPFGGRGRKLTGSLEAHANGFRYSTSRPDERVDVMFGNIKHAFFQPAEKEMITLVHFHLHNHIMVGNKKTKDVQFYIEVIDVVQTIGGGKRSAYDPDEIEEEQRERDRKNKINMDFQNFVNRVNDVWGQPQFKALDLEFDQPLRELGFHGVPHKVSAFIVPTSSCLVELIETPCVVITLSEIEIVNLERVGLGQKNFDMTVVFKDFKRDVLRIDSIPSTSLDGIKEWLNTTDLKYYESRLNLNWRPILKTITDDPEKFIEDGGWEFLNMEVSDSDSENSVDSDQGYVPSDVQSDSGSDDEDDDSESLVESEDDEEEDSEEDSEEEEGKTWEELEREASYADREKGNDSDSEEERKRRKIKALGKSREPARPPTRPQARPPARPPARPLARPPDRRNVSGSLPKRPKLSKEKGWLGFLEIITS